ncbi:MAG TPA: YvrJ family protein [Synergistaceae bacterium]|nr:YvrJ family protein [Synergistaceae bacterium]HQF92284.1 YvrJ family protein [Synergistaceae bacterium]HQH79243.1 YvrJ family protein [Synergistaceae bacterium]HQK25584.1 YvrJ family protein [Synergistaceae bacterium]
MEELLRSALQNGFSIAVAAFLLVRMESRLEALTLAINDLRSVLRPGGNS